MCIGHSVGRGGKNVPEDVVAIRAMLNLWLSTIEKPWQLEITRTVDTRMLNTLSLFLLYSASKDNVILSEKLKLFNTLDAIKEMARSPSLQNAVLNATDLSVAEIIEQRCLSRDSGSDIFFTGLPRYLRNQTFRDVEVEGIKEHFIYGGDKKPNVATNIGPLSTELLNLRSYIQQPTDWSKLDENFLYVIYANSQIISSIMPRFTALKAVIGESSFTINSALRVMHFLGQIGAETAALRLLEEGASAANQNFQKYEPWPMPVGPSATSQAIASVLQHNKGSPKDLGNTEAGDGARFKGRGFLQITGRGNYKAFSAWYNQDFTKDASAPRLATDLNVAASASGWYWSSHYTVSGNLYADQDDVEKVSRFVNCGNANAKTMPYGMPDRYYYTDRGRFIFNITSAAI